MSNASKSFTSMQATRSHRRDVNGMVGQWSTFNQMRTFLREICVPLQPADPLKSTASAALQNGLMFQPHSESLVVETSNHGASYSDWEKVKIGNILTICHGKDYKHLGEGSIPVLGTGGIIGFVDTALCDWEFVTLSIRHFGHLFSLRHLSDRKVWIFTIIAEGSFIGTSRQIQLTSSKEKAALTGLNAWLSDKM